MGLPLPATFDPLLDFDGMWTTELAERYLPLPELPDARYECIDGRLVRAAGGQEFVTTEPFEMRFTPRDLVP